jgi:hypothetical protein
MARPRLLTALILATGFLADGALAQMPPAIATPDEEIVATFRAEGAQTYECKPGNDGKLAWVFREPIATLLSTTRRSAAITPGQPGSIGTAVPSPARRSATRPARQ